MIGWSIIIVRQPPEDYLSNFEREVVLVGLEGRRDRHRLDQGAGPRGQARQIQSGADLTFTPRWRDRSHRCCSARNCHRVRMC
jgi:hypothetical protein